jgi:leucine dehydrogenase
MNLFDRLTRDDFEQVIAFQSRATGLRGFLAIHDTTLGPALGGVRTWRYASDEAALEDALRLARGMTYKAALAELPCGGGKAVILDHDGLARAAAFEAFGRLVESLRGRFHTGVDLGTTDADIAAIARATRHVSHESTPADGEISEHTALGVWHGMRACLEAAGRSGDGGPGAGRAVRVAIQGLGSVGMHLARILRREGMTLVVADVNATAVERARRELGAEIVAPDDILATSCDVLAPCAIGGILNRESILRLQARVICGCANNQLATPEDGDAIAGRGILYAPDYLVNAGGLIRGAGQYLLGEADSRPALARIHGRMTRVLDLAGAEKRSTARIADGLAEARLKRGKTYADLFWGAEDPHR